MGRKKTSSTGNIPARSHLWVGLGIFCIALAVRGLYLLESAKNPAFYFPIVDSRSYSQMAQNLINGQAIDGQFFWQPAFYPLFLSLCYKLSHISIVFVKIVQALIGSLTCVLSYKLGQKVHSKAAGIAAGIITALYLPLVFFEAQLLATGWAAFWSVALILLFIRTRENLSISNGFILGLAGGLSVLTRPVFLPFFALTLVWLVVSLVKDQVKSNRLAVGIFCIVFGFGAVTGPVAVKSFQVMQKASILPHSGGVNFYIGNNADFEEVITIRPGHRWNELMAEPLNQTGVQSHNGAQDYFKQKSLDYMANEPWSFMKGIFYKTSQFISSREMPRNVDIYLFRQWSILLSAGLFKISNAGFPFILLLPFSILGAVFCFRKIPLPLWFFLLIYPASVILFFVTARYRMPIIPVLSVLAGCSGVTLFGMIKNRSYQKLGTALVGMILIGVAMVLPGPFFEEKVDYEAEFYFSLGGSLDQAGFPDRAVAHYQHAATLRENHLDTLYDLAIVLGQQGRHKEAIRHYQKIISIDPEFLQSQKSLGNAFIKLKMYPEALPHLVNAGLLDDQDPEVFINAGNIYAMQGKLDDAILSLNIAYKLQPDNFRTRNNLANIYLSLKKLNEAVKFYRLALMMNNDASAVHSNLGYCLQQQGKDGEAIDAFETALALDPNNGSAAASLELLRK